MLCGSLTSQTDFHQIVRLAVVQVTWPSCDSCSSSVAVPELISPSPPQKSPTSVKSPPPASDPPSSAPTSAVPTPSQGDGEEDGDDSGDETETESMIDDGAGEDGRFRLPSSLQILNVPGSIPGLPWYSVFCRVCLNGSPEDVVSSVMMNMTS